jgi:hypothetical protein
VDSQTLIEQKLKIVRDRMVETRSAFAALRAFNAIANRKDNPGLYKKLLPYGHFFHAANQSLKAFVLSNIVALADTSGSASLYRICRDLINDDSCGVPKGELRRWRTEISAVHNTWKDYRHKFISHISHEADDFIDRFNSKGFSWDVMQELLDDLACKLEFLDAAANGQPVPSVDEVHREVLGFDDLAIDTQEHTAQFLRAVEQHFPSP